MKKILFLGDSITDSHRLWLPPEYEGLGDGFVKLVSDALKNCEEPVQIINKGHDGLTLPGLISRLPQDCYGLQPDIVSILIGINDVGVSRNTGISLKARQFPEQFEYLIQGILENTGARILCLGPFLFPHPEEYLNWIPETLRAEHWILEISANYQLPFCPLQETLNQEAKRQGYDALTTDGIHPTAAGNQIICSQWLSLYHRYCAPPQKALRQRLSSE